MKRIKIVSVSDLEKAIESSYIQPVVLFKHSTRCSISDMALYRVEGFSSESLNNYYYIDLLSYREISDLISEKFNLEHQSPQAIMIKDGQLLHHESHSSINPKLWSAYLD